MTTTLIIIGIFAGFFFLVVRPLQKRSGKYELEIHDSGPVYSSPTGEYRGDPNHHADDKD